MVGWGYRAVDLDVDLVIVIVCGNRFLWLGWAVLVEVALVAAVVVSHLRALIR